MGSIIVKFQKFLIEIFIKESWINKEIGPKLELQKLFLVVLQKNSRFKKPQGKPAQCWASPESEKPVFQPWIIAILKHILQMFLVYLGDQIKPDYKYLQSITNVWREFWLVFLNSFS